MDSEVFYIPFINIFNNEINNINFFFNYNFIITYLYLLYPLTSFFILLNIHLQFNSFFFNYKYNSYLK